MAQAVAEDFRSSLCDLTVNSKPLISMLTMLAEENQKFAKTIVEVIESHIYKAKPKEKLPSVYLIDSIIKNLRASSYAQHFAQIIVKVFCHVFEEVDEPTRQSMFKLRQTWTSLFTARKLYALDVRVNQIDPAWPVSSIPAESENTPKEQTSIHVNPRFLERSTSREQPSPKKQPTETAANDLAAQLKAKEAELEKIKQLQLELELAKAKAQLLQQQRELEELQQKALAPLPSAPTVEAFVPTDPRIPKDPRPARVAALPSDPRLANQPLPGPTTASDLLNSGMIQDPRLPKKEEPKAPEVLPSQPGGTEPVKSNDIPLPDTSQMTFGALLNQKAADVELEKMGLALEECNDAPIPHQRQSDFQRNFQQNRGRFQGNQRNQRGFNNRDSGRDFPRNQRTEQLRERHLPYDRPRSKRDDNGPRRRGRRSRSRSRSTSPRGENEARTSSPRPRKPHGSAASRRSRSRSPRSKERKGKSTKAKSPIKSSEKTTKDSKLNSSKKSSKSEAETKADKPLVENLIEPSKHAVPKIDEKNTEEHSEKSREGQAESKPHPKSTAQPDVDLSADGHKTKKSDKIKIVLDADKKKPELQTSPEKAEVKERKKDGVKDSTSPSKAKGNRKRTDSNSPPRTAAKKRLKKSPLRKSPMPDKKSDTTKKELEAARQKALGSRLKNLPKIPRKQYRARDARSPSRNAEGTDSSDLRIPSDIEDDGERAVRSTGAHVNANADVDLRSLPVVRARPRRDALSDSDDEVLAKVYKRRADRKKKLKGDGNSSSASDVDLRGEEERRGKKLKRKSPVELQDEDSDYRIHPRRRDLEKRSQESELARLGGEDQDLRKRPAQDTSVLGSADVDLRVGRSLSIDTEDRDYRKIIPQSPGAHSGWNKFKQDHPSDFYIPKRRVSAPPPQPDAPIQALRQKEKILSQARAQLKRGEITQQQYQEVEFRFEELEIMRKAKELKSRNITHRDSRDNIDSVIQTLRSNPQLQNTDPRVIQLLIQAQQNSTDPRVRALLDQMKEAAARPGGLLPTPGGTLTRAGPPLQRSDSRNFAPPAPLSKEALYEVVIDNFPYELTMNKGAKKIKIGDTFHQVSADAEARELYIDGQCHYRLGDKPRITHIQGVSHSIYYQGPEADIWINGLQFTVRIDSPPIPFKLQNDTHEIVINGRSRIMTINGIESGRFGGIPRAILINGRAHHVQFEPPPREIMIDGKLCQLKFENNQTVVIIDGIAHGIRFDGPPREIYIDDTPYLIPMDNAVRIRVGMRAHMIKFGGPGRELYIDNKTYEIAFNGPPRQIKIGGKVREVKLFGEPPEVKILDPVRPGRAGASGPGGRMMAAPPLPPIMGGDQRNAGLARPALLPTPPPRQPRMGGPRMRQSDPRQLGPPHKLAGPMDPGSRQMAPPPAGGFPPQGHRGERFQPPQDPPGFLTPGFRGPRPESNDARSGVSFAPPRPDGPVDPRRPFGPRQGSFDPRQASADPHQDPSDPHGASNQMKPPPGALQPPPQLPPLLLGKQLPKPPPQAVEPPKAEPAAAEPEPAAPEPAAPEVDVNDLLAKLVSAGILQKEQDKAEEEAAARTKRAQEEAALLANVPELMDFNVKRLSQSYEGVIQKLYTGQQCSTCGLRFLASAEAKYNEHLDWHFRQRKLEKQTGMHGPARKWFISLVDWSIYEEIDYTDSSVFTDTNTSMADQAQGASDQSILPTETIHCPKASSNADDTCYVCHDPFERYWDDEDEDWRLREAIRVNNKTYHPVCYEDAMDQSMIDSFSAPGDGGDDSTSSRCSSIKSPPSTPDPFALIAAAMSKPAASQGASGGKSGEGSKNGEVKQDKPADPYSLFSGIIKGIPTAALKSESVTNKVKTEPVVNQASVTSSSNSSNPPNASNSTPTTNTAPLTVKSEPAPSVTGSSQPATKPATPQSPQSNNPQTIQPLTQVSVPPTRPLVNVPPKQTSPQILNSPPPRFSQAPPGAMQTSPTAQHLPLMPLPAQSPRTQAQPIQQNPQFAPQHHLMPQQQPQSHQQQMSQQQQPQQQQFHQPRPSLQQQLPHQHQPPHQQHPSHQQPSPHQQQSHQQQLHHQQQQQLQQHRSQQQHFQQHRSPQQQQPPIQHRPHHQQQLHQQPPSTMAFRPTMQQTMITVPSSMAFISSSGSFPRSPPFRPMMVQAHNAPPCNVMMLQSAPLVVSQHNAQPTQQPLDTSEDGGTPVRDEPGDGVERCSTPVMDEPEGDGGSTPVRDE